MKRTKKEVYRTGNECNKIDCVSWHVEGSIFGSDVKFCKECKWAYKSQYQCDPSRAEVKDDILRERKYGGSTRAHHK